MRVITVTRRRSTPGGRDKYNDPIASTTTEVEIEGCAIAPRSSEDIDDRGRRGTVVGLTLYAPAGADIVAGDQIIYRGDPYSIVGEVGTWENPTTGEEKGMEIALRKAVG